MSYNESHPWYYYLGGRIQYPREIRETVRSSGYRGWMEKDILRMAAMPEPARSTKLRDIRQEVVAQYRSDVTRYREYARELHRYRRKHYASADDSPSCDGVHVSIGLKYAHLFNDFAHLLLLDELLARQPDLFGA